MPRLVALAVAALRVQAEYAFESTDEQEMAGISSDAYLSTDDYGEVVFDEMIGDNAEADFEEGSDSVFAEGADVEERSDAVFDDVLGIWIPLSTLQAVVDATDNHSIDIEDSKPVSEAFERGVVTSQTDDFKSVDAPEAVESYVVGREEIPAHQESEAFDNAFENEYTPNVMNIEGTAENEYPDIESSPSESAQEGEPYEVEAKEELAEAGLDKLVILSDEGKAAEIEEAEIEAAEIEADEIEEAEIEEAEIEEAEIEAAEIEEAEIEAAEIEEAEIEAAEIEAVPAGYELPAEVVGAEIENIETVGSDPVPIQDQDADGIFGDVIGDFAKIGNAFFESGAAATGIFAGDMRSVDDRLNGPRGPNAIGGGMMMPTGPMGMGRMGMGPMGMSPMGMGPMGMGPMPMSPMGMGPMGMGRRWLEEAQEMKENVSKEENEEESVTTENEEEIPTKENGDSEQETSGLIGGSRGILGGAGGMLEGAFRVLSGVMGMIF